MASRDRERELARQHHERQQQRRTARRRQQRRNQVIAAVLSALVVIGAAVWLGLARGGDEDVIADPGTPAPAPSASAPSAAAPSASSTSSSSPAAPCPSEAPTPQASAPAFPSPDPQSLAASSVVTATLMTNCGPITIALDPAKAPETVNSFVFLARKGFFDNTPCHRITTEGIYVLQCGDPTGAGTGGPGYTIPLENAPETGVYPAGTVAMARSTAPDSGGSQFFLVYQDSRLPAPGYSIFGQVSEGLDVVTNVAAAGASGGTDGAPAQPIGIQKATITEAKA